MDNFLLIDFNDFKQTQICEFVTERLHSKVREKILYLNNIILSNSLRKDVYSSNFHDAYLNLVDKVNQLIKLESCVLFEYVNAQQSQSSDVTIPISSVLHIRQFQYDVKHTLLNTRVLFQELEKDASYQTITSIIELELHNMESIIIQWFHIVNKNILTSNGNTTNYKGE